jgi:hypothetical protein
MIWIIQGQANIIAVTLTEKCTLTQPNFLFRLVNDETNIEYTFIAADTSEYVERYNKFTITETADPDNLNGEVELPATGFYHYYIYEQESDTNLDYTLSATLVEIGKCKVPGEGASLESYAPASSVNITYKPTNI